jgi:ATP-binding cassette subfamily B protein
METEKQIQDSLRHLEFPCTKIIIAQRVASVQECDMIIIMDGGMIAGKGTHEELLKSNAIYREIYEEQTKGGSGDE